MHTFKEKLTAFTLVELIVVITILAVLATIGFVSFQGYGVSSRDSVRLADMTSIEKGFSIKLTKAEKLPIPDDKIDITASGTLLNYQGYAGTGVLGTVGVHGGGVDPIDGAYYTLSVNPARNKYQLVGFFENSEYAFLQNNTYANLSQRYPKVKGDELGIIINPISHIPINTIGNNIDLFHTNDIYKGIINNTDSYIHGTGAIFQKKLDFRINPIGSCEAILKNGKSNGNGMYEIKLSTNGEEVQVYCDMVNGGFTGLISVNPAGTTWKYDSTQWTNPTFNTNDFINQETTLKSYTDFTTMDINICRGNINNCYTIQHNKNISLHDFYVDDISYTDFSVFKPKSNLPNDNSHNVNYPDNIGSDKTQQYVNALQITYPVSSAYNKYGVGINLTLRNKLGFQGDNNGTWPSIDNLVIGIGGFAPYGHHTVACTGGFPYHYSNATSVYITGGPCYYENIDDKMWYVLGK